MNAWQRESPDDRKPHARAGGPCHDEVAKTSGTSPVTRASGPCAQHSTTNNSSPPNSIVHYSSRLRVFALAFLFLFIATLTPAHAADTEGCLTCHQYRGLSRIGSDGKSISLFYVDPNYFGLALGPHARLKCTDCHIRSEVEVFPHKTPTPVDCGKTCHLIAPGKVEIRFSHDRVDGMLDKSIHKQEVLDQANVMLGSPLKADQSRCLLCHDEPTFRRSGQNWVDQETPIQRCNNCHDEQMPADTRHFYWHIEARSKPARDNADMVRVCAQCHSNPTIQAKFKLPDVTMSYLQSFHGKATQLGSQETANCIDCHVGQMQNVHVMKAHSDPSAPTNAAHLADTCRTSKCHRQAGQQISTAAVHLDVSRDRGPEYFIAVAFVVLIVLTFGPSLILTVLKMAQIVIGRRDPQEHHYHKLAHQLLALPEGREQLKRFTVHQRVQHWYLAITFITLVLTGFPMKFADQAWAAWVINVFGGISIARRVHHVAGAMLIVGLFYHAIYVARVVRRQAKATGQNPLRIFFGLPMMVSPADMMQMNGLMLYLLGLKSSRPAGGRFNPEEKFEYIGVFWGSIVLGTTGVLMWFHAWTTSHLPGRIITIATLFHTMEAFLALLHVGIVHMAGVIFSPGVFPVSKAMFTGDTPAEELAEAHTGMLTAAKDLLDQPTGQEAVDV
jgi:cytochrome b subunit of formate dehydrogenase/nitrate reductase cytochrome c-type subunit